ncbi:MAG: PAS domain-containing protein [Geobacteraceae bacterium]|nr:PAS domain-containing protein [Geobacteraceae bacterium]
MPKMIKLIIIVMLMLFSPLSSTVWGSQPLKVGYFDYIPLSYRDKNNDPAGFFVDIARHVAANEEWSLTFVHGTLQEGLERLAKGEIDLLLCISYSEERAAKYDLTSESLLTDWGVVYRKKGQQINTILDMDGKTVAGRKGGIILQTFLQLANQFNINVKVLELDSNEELLSDRAYEAVDAIVIGNLATFSNADDKKFIRTPINFSPTKMVIAATQGKNPDIMHRLDRRIKSLKDNKDSIYYRKLEEITAHTHTSSSPFLLWGLVLLGSALLISFAFVVTLTRIVKRKTEGMKKYSIELESREEQFRLAMQASRDGLWDWNILTGEVYFSPSYFRIIGFEPDELPHELSTWLDRIHPDDMESALKANTECIEGISETFSVEFRMLSKSGDWIWTLTRGAAVQRREDGRATRVIGTHTNITALVETRNALRESEGRLKLATTAAHLGIWDWDLQSGNLVWDDTVFEIYGLPRSDQSVSKKAWEESIHEDDRQEVVAKLNAAIVSDTIYENEYRIVRADNSTRIIKTFAALIRENGLAIRVIGMDKDVTKRRMLEHQIRQTQKMDAIGRLAGGIAHDFNNKLTVILGYSELIKMLECVEANSCNQYLDEIIKAANHSQEITKKLLAFSRDETPETCHIDINYMLAEMKKTLGRLIGERIAVSFEMSGDLWPVKMNPTEYDQIIMNLVVNARDALPEGGKIFISTSNETIDIQPHNACMDSSPGYYAVTTVSDNGCGMSPELIERIFDPFFTTKPSGKGTGLGLSTVYGIVSRYKGFITLESSPHEGSTFRIYLPRSIELEDGDSVVEEMGEIRGSGVILLVEDEVAVREMTQLFLESIGYSVIMAENPMHAVRLCEDRDTQIDCVLSDVIMPEVNGRQLQEMILAIRPELPFLFMSGYTSDILTEHGVAEHGLNFISKPLNFRSLHDKLALLTGNDLISPKMPG